MLDTANPNNYEYTTKYLEIHILGGIKTTKLESMRATLSVQKLKQENILRHTIDLYNDNQVEKFTRTVAERLEIGTSVVRRDLQGLTRELENHRFLLIEKEQQAAAPYHKELSATEEKEAIRFLKSKDLLGKTNGLIGKSGVNGEQEHKAKELLKNVQRVLKSVKVINPFVEYLQLPKSVFKPRRTNSHYLQFIEAITFYKSINCRDTQKFTNKGKQKEI